MTQTPEPTPDLTEYLKPEDVEYLEHYGWQHAKPEPPKPEPEPPKPEPPPTTTPVSRMRGPAALLGELEAMDQAHKELLGSRRTLESEIEHYRQLALQATDPELRAGYEGKLAQLVQVHRDHHRAQMREQRVNVTNFGESKKRTIPAAEFGTRHNSLTNKNERKVDAAQAALAELQSTLAELGTRINHTGQLTSELELKTAAQEKWVATALWNLAFVAVGVCVLFALFWQDAVQDDAQHQHTTHSVLCPMYAQQLDGYNPDSRTAGPDRDNYITVMGQIRKSYQELGCR